ncbi:MAG TPA: adenylate/guanylate cyclase domain-containing protein [Gemmatimonadota bacterium]|nr:adenylate/guanylate cyclase domain-containing protein [Gemmatimonadota bacterium]
MSGPQRSLATILFTDIVGSTERAAELGDRGWQELLAEHHARVRREIRRFGGNEANTAGDGFLATFERPARAIRCAWAIRESMRELGLEVRSGIHAAEVEGAGRDLGGIGVHIGARIASQAGPGEVLVSSTVRELVTGAGFQFEDRGSRPLKGVPEEWHLYALKGLPAGTPALRPGRWVPEVSRRHLAMAGALALLLGIGAFVVLRPESGPALTPEEVLAADADPGIAVLPFWVNDAELDTWREGMVDLLSVNLDGVPDLRAIDSRTLLARWGEAVPDTARADLATALAVARRTGARYALVGTVVAVGSDLRLSAEVYEARGGAKLGSAQVVGAPDSMLVLVNRLTMEVLRALPREGSVLADVDLAEVTTDSLVALKAFLSGEVLYRRADFQGAAAAFEQAIASDSTFALAWARLDDTCGWNLERPSSELCGREPPWERDEYLSRLPARKAELRRAMAVIGRGAREGIEALQQMVRKYPDDPEVWYQLGDGYFHWGPWALMDHAEGFRALERAIALAPTTSAEPYIHLIQHAFAEADSARVARLLEAYERITHGAGLDLAAFRLAFALGFGDPATRAQTRAALDTIPTPTLTEALLLLRNPRLFEVTEEALRVLLARPDHRQEWGPLFWILYYRGKLGAALDELDVDVTEAPLFRPAYRAPQIYRLHQVGVDIAPDELERILAAGAADTTDGLRIRDFSTFLWFGAYAVDRENWEQYAAALDRQRARARGSLAQGLTARSQEGAARALEGYALWRRGQRAEAIRALETAQRQINGFGTPFGTPFGPNTTVRWWLGELMLEVGRPRDAERYFKSIWTDPFAALRLGKVYEELGEFEEARESYEYALLSWQDADPELQPRIQEARQALARLPKPIRRD